MTCQTLLGWTKRWGLRLTVCKRGHAQQCVCAQQLKQDEASSKELSLRTGSSHNSLIVLLQQSYKLSKQQQPHCQNAQVSTTGATSTSDIWMSCSFYRRVVNVFMTVGDLHQLFSKMTHSSDCMKAVICLSGCHVLKDFDHSKRKKMNWNDAFILSDIKNTLEVTLFHRQTFRLCFFSVSNFTYCSEFYFTVVQKHVTLDQQLPQTCSAVKTRWCEGHCACENSIFGLLD